MRRSILTIALGLLLLAPPLGAFGSVNVTYLIVGGGGAGGSTNGTQLAGGGGGGGQVLTGTDPLGSGSYSIVVGATVSGCGSGCGGPTGNNSSFHGHTGA